MASSSAMQAPSASRSTPRRCHRAAPRRRHRRRPRLPSRQHTGTARSGRCQPRSYDGLDNRARVPSQPHHLRPRCPRANIPITMGPSSRAPPRRCLLRCGNLGRVCVTMLSGGVYSHYTTTARLSAPHPAPRPWQRPHVGVLPSVPVFNNLDAIMPTLKHSVSYAARTPDVVITQFYFTWLLGSAVCRLTLPLLDV